MNYEKTKKVLKDLDYIDERNIVCFSLANKTESNYYFFFSIATKEKQTNLPKCMLLSLKGDQLIISEAKSSGKFKAFFDSISLKALSYVGKEEGVYDTHHFHVLNPDGSQGDFKINTVHPDDTYYAGKLVKTILEWQKDNFKTEQKKALQAFQIKNF